METGIDSGPAVVQYKEWVCREYGAVLDCPCQLCGSLFWRRAGPAAAQRQQGECEHDMSLGGVYTEPLLVERQQELTCEEEDACLRGETFQFYLTPRASQAYHSTRLDRLFSGPAQGYMHTHTHTSAHTPPRAVILQGQAGYGKSLMVQKLLVDWAKGCLYKELFDLVFLMHCNKLGFDNPSSAADLSLVDVLSSHDSSFTPVVSQALQDHPERVLVIVDGFEELQLPLESPDLPQGLQPPSTDPHAQAPVVAMLGALLRGLLLPECSLLVTTRPEASARLSRVLRQPHNTADLLGFSDEATEEYFRKCLGEDGEELEERSSRACGRLRENTSLWAACSVPLLCSLVCTVLTQDVPEDGKDSAGALDASTSVSTSTALYAWAVSALLRCHCQASGQPRAVLLRALARLAERGTLEQRPVFDEASVCEAAGPSVCEAAPAGPSSPPLPFLRAIPAEGGRSAERGARYAFAHPTLQEFFAALSQAWPDTSGAPRSRQQLLLSLQGEEQISPEPHLLGAGRFLCGLANASVRNIFADTLLPQATAVVGVADLEEWILSLVADVQDSYRNDHLKLHVLHCLHELHDDDVAARALEAWGMVQLHSVTLTTADCWALRYCLLCGPANGSLSLWRCHVTVKMLRVLKPALARCHELELQVEGLSDADIPDLISVLGEEKNLRELGVAGSRLCDDSVQQVLTCLSQQECVGFISFSVQSISPRTVIMLAQLLQTTEFELAELTSSDKESCCSHFSMDASTVTLSHFHTTQLMVRDSLVPDTAPSGGWPTDPAAPGLSFSVSESAALSQEDWEALLNTYQALRASQQQLTTQCFAEYVRALFSFLESLPRLLRVELEVRQLTLTWAGELFSIIHTCPSLTHASVQEFSLCSGSGESLCSSISLERDESNTSLLTTELRHREEGDGDSVCVEQQHPSPACVRLILTHSARVNQHSWTALLHTFHTLSSRVYEEQASALVSALCCVCGLKKVFVRVSCLTLHWATALLHFIHTCPSLQDASVTDEMPLECYQEEQVCSSLMLKRDEEGFTFAAMHPYRVDPEPEFSSVSLTVSEATDVSTEYWRDVLQEFSRLKPVTESSPLFYERVDALLTSLHSLSGLKSATLSVRCLTESWASRILTLVHSCPSLQYSSLQVAEPKITDEDSLCSTLLVTKEPGNLRLVVQQAVCLAKEPRLSGLCFSIPPPADLPWNCTSWIGVLLELHTLKYMTEGSPGFDEHVESLMVFLRSVPELRELSLKLLCVSAHWVSRILSLIQSCPSLLTVRLVAGQGWLGDGLIHKEAVLLLNDSKIRPDCTLVIEGKRCSKHIDQCAEYKDHSLSCNTAVVIKSHGESFQVTELDDQD